MKATGGMKRVPNARQPEGTVAGYTPRHGYFLEA
jgi:hypothetical protein